MAKFLEDVSVFLLFVLLVVDAKPRRRDINSSSQQTDIDYDDDVDPPTFDPPKNPSNNWPRPPKNCMPPMGFPMGPPPGPPPPGCMPLMGFPGFHPFGPPPGMPSFNSHSRPSRPSRPINSRRAPNKRRPQRRTG
ncbi:hypothetical protein M3Y97_00181200 [Aphelenchoides bicaudatus]|nr:hypothetical protein M3Y97_00181200 [Aphelenchoides bicaudatus]